MPDHPGWWSYQITPGVEGSWVVVMVFHSDGILSFNLAERGDSHAKGIFIHHGRCLPVDQAPGTWGVEVFPHA